MSRLLNAQTGGINPLTGAPSTAAGISLWNGESQTSGTGLFYVIDSIYCWFNSSQGAATHISLWVQTNTGVKTKPSGGACTAITSYGELIAATAAANTFVSNSVFVSGATVANDFWTPYGPSLVTPNTANGFMQNDVPLEGYMLTPGQLFSVQSIVPGGGAGSINLGITWRELTGARARGALMGSI